MAKRTDPITDPVLSPLFAKIATVRDTNGINTARIRPPIPEEWLAYMELESELRAHIKAGWDALAGWKRYRWALCAWRKGIPTDPATGYPGWSGFTLYTKMWREQHTEPGKQPISPCSRRATDPDADPWDYTP